MKWIIKNTLLCVVLLMSIAACEEEAALVNLDITHGKSTEAVDEVTTSVAVLQSESEPGRELILRDFVDQTGDKLYVQLAKPAEKDMSLKIEIESLESGALMKIVERYHVDHQRTTFIEDWHDYFSIANEGKITIKAGEQISSKIDFTLLKMGYEKSYVLPLIALDEDGNQYRLLYYLTEKETMRQDRNKKDYTMVAYINTEIMNPLIADQFTETRKYFISRRESRIIYEDVPIIDVLNLRKSYIRYDAVSQRAMLKYTADMEYVLKNRNKYIQPLQRSGIKVCLTVEGGGTGLGFANLTDRQIADFTAQIEVALKMYDLDGVNLRDEGVGYGKNELPGINEVSYPKLIKSLREAMPDQIITIADDGGTTASMCNDQSGIAVGDYIDFAWNVDWDNLVNPWEEASERNPIAGLDKDRYGGISFLIKNRNSVEENALLEKLMIQGRKIALEEGLGKVLVVDNLPYMDYGFEDAPMGGLEYIISCTCENNGGYPQYRTSVAASSAALQYYAFKKDW